MSKNDILTSSRIQSHRSTIQELPISNNPSIENFPPEFISLFTNLPKNESEQLISLLKIILKKPKTRTEKEENELLLFFQKTKIEENIKDDLTELNVNFTKLYQHIIQNMSIETFDINDYIYKFGDKVENFYILLNGNVSIYEIKKEKCSLTGEEYYMYLYNEIKNNTDEYLINSTMIENQEAFPIEKYNDIENFPEILFMVKLAVFGDLGYPKKLEQLFEEYNKDPNEFLFEEYKKEEITLDAFNNIIMRKITKREQFYFKILQGEVSERPKNKQRKEVVKIITEKSRDICKYDYIGNYVISDQKQMRNESIKCDGVCILLAINKKAYVTDIIHEIKDKKQKEYDFLFKSYFFNALRKSAFTNDFFEKLTTDYYLAQSVIFTQGDTLENFSIIRSGLIELTLNNTSLLELKEMIQNLKKLLPKNTEYVNEEDYTLEYPENQVKDSLTLKRKFLLFKSEKGLFGDMEFYYNIPTICTAVVLSDKAMIYKYSYSDFSNINEDIFLLKRNLQRSAEMTLKSYIERLIAINNSFYLKLNQELGIKTLEQRKLLEKIGYKEPPQFKPIKISSIRKKISSDIRDIDKLIGLPKNDTKNNLDDIISGFQIKINEEDKMDGSIRKKLEAKRNKDLSASFSFSLNKEDNKTKEITYLPLITAVYSPLHSENNVQRKKKVKEREYGVIFPKRIARNAPLINRLKYPIAERIPFKDKNIKMPKVIKSEQFNKKITINSFMKAYPGSYFLAVHEYLDNQKKKMIK